MTAVDDRPVNPSTATPIRPGREASRGWFMQLLLRLHFTAGLFIGPFILIAALSGAAYALGPRSSRSSTSMS